MERRFNRQKEEGREAEEGKKAEREQQKRQEEERKPEGRKGEEEEPEISAIEQTDPLVFEVRLSAGDLWKFSMYYSYRGLKGLFNFIFTAAAVYLLVTNWNIVSVWYRALLVICALMFTVWHPSLLYLKAARQAKAPAMKNPTRLSFSKEGIVVSQGEERLYLTWEAIALAEQVSTLLIIYMDRVHAYLLPDSLTGDGKEELCGLIRQMLPPGRRKRV